MNFKYPFILFKDIINRKKKVETMQKYSYHNRNLMTNDLDDPSFFTLTKDSIMKLKELDSFDKFDLFSYQWHANRVEAIHDPAYLMIGNRIDSRLAKTAIETLNMKLQTIDISVFDDESVLQSSGKIYHFDTLPQYPKIIDILLDLTKLAEFIPDSNFILLIFNILYPRFPELGIYYKDQQFHLVNLSNSIKICEFFLRTPQNTNYDKLLDFEEIVQLELKRYSL